MVVREDEIDRIVDETFAGRGINTSLFCVTCGYNLRGLPFIGVCPECGHRYNARARKMTGIFLPHQLEFPRSDILATVLSLVLTVVLIAVLWLPFALVFGVLGLFSVWLTYRKLKQYVHFRGILRRIEAEEEG